MKRLAIALVAVMSIVFSAYSNDVTTCGPKSPAWMSFVKNGSTWEILAPGTAPDEHPSSIGLNIKHIFCGEPSGEELIGLHHVGLASGTDENYFIYQTPPTKVSKNIIVKPGNWYITDKVCAPLGPKKAEVCKKGGSSLFPDTATQSQIVSEILNESHLHAAALRPVLEAMPGKGTVCFPRRGHPYALRVTYVTQKPKGGGNTNIKTAYPVENCDEISAKYIIGEAAAAASHDTEPRHHADGDDDVSDDSTHHSAAAAVARHSDTTASHTKTKSRESNDDDTPNVKLEPRKTPAAAAPHSDTTTGHKRTKSSDSNAKVLVGHVHTKDARSKTRPRDSKDESEFDARAEHPRSHGARSSIPKDHIKTERHDSKEKPNTELRESNDDDTPNVELEH